MSQFDEYDLGTGLRNPYYYALLAEQKERRQKPLYTPASVLPKPMVQPTFGLTKPKLEPFQFKPLSTSQKPFGL